MRNCTWSLNDKVRDNSQTSPAVLISSTRRILTQRFSEQDLAPFMIHELLLSPTETASGSHPCCVVSVTYHRPSYFHGGNTGSNPVGDANKIKYLQEPQFPTRYAHYSTVLFASDQAKHLSVRHLLLVRHRFIVDVHRHFDGVVAQQPLDDLRIAVILPQQGGIGMAQRVPSLDFDSCLACRRLDVVLHDATHPVRLFALHFGAGEDVVVVLGIGCFPSPSQQFIEE